MYVTYYILQSTPSKTDTFGTGTKCPSYRGVHLIEVSGKRESNYKLTIIIQV